VLCLGNPEREGALSVIGSVSPPGGDLGDPVVQATLRVVKVFWSLEDKLAYQRHFPAISWLNSYSLYQQDLVEDLSKKVASDFIPLARDAMAILQKEAELLEIVRLIGKDTLSPSDRLILEAARIIREDFLHQNAFLEIDTYTSLKKQYEMLKICLYFYQRAKKALEENKITIEEIEKLKVRERIAKMKFVREEDVEKEFNEIKKEIEECLK
jgi:V/A-type H+-transporting ATPase subunit A